MDDKDEQEEEEDDGELMKEGVLVGIRGIIHELLQIKSFTAEYVAQLVLPDITKLLEGEKEYEK